MLPKWFYCKKPGCDQSPFMVTSTELADAEGVMTCEYCGGPCQEIPPAAEHPYYQMQSFYFEVGDHLPHQFRSHMSIEDLKALIAHLWNTDGVTITVVNDPPSLFKK